MKGVAKQAVGTLPFFDAVDRLATSSLFASSTSTNLNAMIAELQRVLRTSLRSHCRTEATRCRRSPQPPEEIATSTAATPAFHIIVRNTLRLALNSTADEYLESVTNFCNGLAATERSRNEIELR